MRSISNILQDRSRIIAGFNIFFGIILIIPFVVLLQNLISNFTYFRSSDDSETFISAFLFVLIPLILLLTNLFFGWKIIITQEKIKRKYFILSSVVSSITFSLLAIFPGYFFTNNPFFLIVTLLFIALFLFANWKEHKIIGVIFSCLMIGALLYSFPVAFEENYCWAKGDEAYNLAVKEGRDPYNAPITEGEKRDGWSNISVAYRAHMDCHKNFDFWSAIKEKSIFYKPTLQELQKDTPTNNPYREE